MQKPLASRLGSSVSGVATHRLHLPTSNSTLGITRLPCLLPTTKLKGSMLIKGGRCQAPLALIKGKHRVKEPLLFDGRWVTDLLRLNGFQRRSSGNSRSNSRSSRRRGWSSIGRSRNSSNTRPFTTRLLRYSPLCHTRPAGTRNFFMRLFILTSDPLPRCSLLALPVYGASGRKWRRRCGDLGSALNSRCPCLLPGI